jgi:hypothetical protein
LLRVASDYADALFNLALATTIQMARAGLRLTHYQTDMVDHMKTKTCPDCNGDGVLDKGTDDEHQCPVCGGSGVVPDDDDDEEIIRTQPKL